MKKALLVYLLILFTEFVVFFMGMGFVLIMYRVFAPYVRWMWLFGAGWVILLSLVSFLPLHDLYSKIKE
ncbi:hypothetical protein [Thermospira aquatica]|uniref:Uncharacterized protein n=1 Tax=Thermospira aquatica TaxID=2828656 RepID=A0AAX3BEI5_9SPIR|nr:hypothetical protein [Thermospira aquatica]URA10753.1 hypothetical protein KDW03_02820 [Thermospira aquatica]